MKKGRAANSTPRAPTTRGPKPNSSLNSAHAKPSRGRLALAIHSTAPPARPPAPGRRRTPRRRHRAAPRTPPPRRRPPGRQGNAGRGYGTGIRAGARQRARPPRPPPAGSGSSIPAPAPPGGRPRGRERVARQPAEGGQRGAEEEGDGEGGVEVPGRHLAPLDQGVEEQQLHGQIQELDHAEGKRADPELGRRQRPAEDDQRGEGEARRWRRFPAPSRTATGPRARVPRRSPGPSAGRAPARDVAPPGRWECGARPRGILPARCAGRRAGHGGYCCSAARRAARSGP